MIKVIIFDLDGVLVDTKIFIFFIKLCAKKINLKKYLMKIILKYLMDYQLNLKLKFFLKN